MLVIRLSRTGRKKQPYYRMVVAEKSAAVKGSYLEVLGHFNPRTKELKVDVEKAKARLKNGAQPSETAEALLEKAGVLKREDITEKNRRPERKKKKDIKAEAAAEGQAPTAAKPAESEAKAEEAKPEVKADTKAEPKDEAKTEDKPKEPETKPDEGDSK